jgi:hypothetical protein
MNDLDNEKEEYTNILKDIYSVTNTLNIKAFIWGGFVQDIIENQYSRKHKDLDMFIEELDTKKEIIIKAFIEKNYKYEYKESFKMLVLYKNNIHVAINPIMFDHNIAIWKHIGDKGFVVFPKEWLDKEPREFNGINILTAGIKFEYGFRKIAKYLNPEWKEREKDIIGMEYYKNKLMNENIKEEDILNNIYSYNPFWLEYGYNGFKDPVIVIGKNYL